MNRGLAWGAAASSLVAVALLLLRGAGATGPWQDGRLAAELELCLADTVACPTFAATPDDAPLPYRVRILEDADDPIAQWGDALQSFWSCTETAGGLAAADIRACVEASTFPEACKDVWRTASGGRAGLDPLMDVFDSVFVATEGPCAPLS